MYRALLRLYPAVFRSEFQEQMLLDFMDMAVDARKRGRLSFFLFSLRELVDFPINLLKVYLMEGRMFRILRSQPVRYGLRAAIGFGAAFPMSVLGFVFTGFASESLTIELEVFYYDLFHALPLYEIISWIPVALGFLLAGLLVGGLLAVLFADRSNYSRYVLSGMLGWFLCRSTFDLSNSYQWAFFLGTRHNSYFHIALLILGGAFLGLILIVARSERREPLRLLMLVAITYPLLAYLYVKLLFKFSIVEAPWLFIALMSLITIYMIGVLALAIKSDGGRKNLWLIAVSAIGYPLLAYAGILIASMIFSPTLPTTIYPGGDGFWPMVLAIVLSQAIYGILFGLLVGAVWGIQKKTGASQAMASA
jgi:hypothetical protein